MIVDLTLYGHVWTHGRLIAANSDVTIADTSHGLALCDNPMTGNPLMIAVGDLEVMRECPHELRAIVRAYMLRTRVAV